MDGIDFHPVWIWPISDANRTRAAGFPSRNRPKLKINSANINYFSDLGAKSSPLLAVKFFSHAGWLGYDFAFSVFVGVIRRLAGDRVD